MLGTRSRTWTGPRLDLLEAEGKFLVATRSFVARVSPPVKSKGTQLTLTEMVKRKRSSE